MVRRKERAELILHNLLDKNPNPATELNYQSSWQLLAAAMLSAQSTDKQVNKVTNNLFRKYPGPKEISALSPEQLAEEIKSIGLFRNKSKYILAASRAISERYGGEVPRDRRLLENLPGVGRKTANVVLANAFGIPALAVDTHVFRVANRLGLAKADTPLKAEKQLMRAIPRSMWSAAHHLLILHGRYICTARNPRCGICPVNIYCASFGKLPQ